MNDRGGDRPDDRREGGDREGERGRDREGERGGPPGTDWLQLEMSKVMYGRAEAMVTDCAEEILREEIKARLRERIGPRLTAIARLAADTLADDIEASLDIEARIAARREARRGVEGRVAAIAGVEPARPEGSDPHQG